MSVEHIQIIDFLLVMLVLPEEGLPLELGTCDVDGSMDVARGT